MNTIVFFVFDPSPRIERRIESMIDAGFQVVVYGFQYDIVNVQYCHSSRYCYNILATIPHSTSYFDRLKGLKKVRDAVKKFDKSNTLFYFFSLNVAAIAPFLGIKYIYEESDMLFDRFNNRFIRKMVISFNKYTIRRSVITVMTSEGFAKFYYGEHVPNNIAFVLNKVNTKCQQQRIVDKPRFDANHIRFGFAGNIRYQATLNLATTIAKLYPNHEFHFWGNTESLSIDQLASLKELPNVFFHGIFKNPQDLPEIYASMDFCVCNYDICGVNPRFAEPNKLYEALFFNTPIMVSPYTFVGEKVKKLGVGFEIDSYDSELIKNAIDSIDDALYGKLTSHIKAIPKESLVTDTTALINRIKAL